MKDAKLIQILQTFTPGELKRFREFIGAEFNHVPANLLALLDNIVKEGIGTELTKESLWVSVYGDMPYNDGKLRAGFSQLSKIAEEFLAFIGWQKNSGVKMTYLLNELNKRGLDKHFKSTLKRVQGEFSSGLVDTSLLLAEHLVMAEEVQFQYKQLGRSKKIDLLPASKTLDHFYVLTKLKYACQAINFQTVLNTSFDISFIDVIEKYVVDNEKLPSIIRVYHGLLQLLRSPENEELYHYVAGLIEQYKNGFSKAELWGMIGYLINYCIRRANQGTPDFLNHLLKWYKEALKEELLLENGTLSHWNYKNIVSVGLQVEEFLSLIHI